jgi:hypothetical protein
MKPEGSLPCSQYIATGSHPVPAETNLHQQAPFQQYRRTYDRRHVSWINSVYISRQLRSCYMLSASPNVSLHLFALIQKLPPLGPTTANYD